MEDKKQIKAVMKYFNCNEEMAKRIIQASVKNGEISRIDKLCENDWRKER